MSLFYSRIDNFDLPMKAFIFVRIPPEPMAMKSKQTSRVPSPAFWAISEWNDTPQSRARPTK